MMPQQYSESPDLDTVVETSIGDHSALVVEAALPLVEHVESTFMVEVALVESACQDTVAAPSIPSRIVTAIQCLGFDCNENSFDLNLCISNCVPELCTTVPQGSDPPTIRSSNKCWEKNYTVLSFLMNGQLFAEYKRVANMLGLPSCSKTQWVRIVNWTELHVTQLAEWSCEQVRSQIRKRGDHHQWVASYDGFYLTRGHYSNNSSGTIHNFTTGNVAWFTHRTRRGIGHNWEGTSAGAEGNMYDELLQKVKAADFSIKEIVTDKDSSGNAIFCNHFPEGSITYCSNHSAKTLHKELQKIKAIKCKVRNEIKV